VPNVRTGDCQNFFKQATSEQLHAFCDAGYTVHFGTQEVGTLLYVPPMSIVSERGIGPNEFAGIRVGVLPKQPSSTFMPSLKTMLQEVEAVKGNGMAYQLLITMVEAVCIVPTGSDNCDGEAEASAMKTQQSEEEKRNTEQRRSARDNDGKATATGMARRKRLAAAARTRRSARRGSDA
jgi:hypothetical protein